MFSRRRIGVIAAVVAAGLVSAGVFVVSDDEQPSPPVKQPVPRGLDDQGDLRLIRQTPTRIVLGWTPELTGYGYLFSGDGTVVARTTDPARDQATFRNIYTSYEVAAIDKGDTGTYAPLAGTLTMTVIAETANTITFGWTPQAEYGYLFSGDGDVISRTYDPDRSYAKFNKLYTDYEVAVLVKGVTGTYPPVAAGTAQFWIDTSGGSCTRQNPADGYDNDGTECDSFNEAYQAAQLGDLVLVMGGSYPAQVIDDEASKDTTGLASDVVIEEAEGQTVTVADLALGSSCCEGTDGPDHLTIRAISDDSFTSGDCDWSSFGGDIYDITFDNIHTCNFTINHEQPVGMGDDVSDYLTIKNSELGPCDDMATPGLGCGNNKIDGSDNFVFQNNYVHDYRCGNNVGECHFECMFISDTDSALIERNQYEDCDFFDIFMQPCNPANGGRCIIENVTVQNNFLEGTWDGAQQDGGTPARRTPGTNIEGTSVNLLVRYNVFYNGGHSTTGAQTNVRYYGNIFGGTACGLSGQTYDYNIFAWGASTCGTNATTATASDVLVNDNYQDAGGDWHLKSGANTAVDYVTPTSSDYALNDDIDGDTRPAGSARDAGADER